MGKRQIAMENDDRLLRIAFYEETKGLTRQLKTQDQIMGRFVEFKRLVKRGDFTIQGLEDSVFERQGVIEKRSEDDVSEFLSALQKIDDSARKDGQINK